MPGWRVFIQYEVEPDTIKILGTEARMETREKKEVIAYRKKCKADGTGLSHYILMDKKGR